MQTQNPRVESNSHFQRQTNTRSLTVAERISNANQLLETAVSHYKDQRDISRAHVVLLEAEEAVQNLFDIPENERLITEEFESRLNVCGKFNNHVIIQEVKDLYTKERSHEEATRRVPEFRCMEMSVIMRTNRSPAKSQTAPPESARRQKLTESVVSKEGEKRPPFEVEEIAIDKNAADFKIEFMPTNSPSIYYKQTEAGISSPLKAENIQSEEVKAESPKAVPIVESNTKAETGVRQELDGIVEMIKDHFENKRIDGSNECLEKLKSFSTRDLSPEEQSYYQDIFVQNQRMFSDIEDFYRDFKVVLKEIEDDEGYIVENVKKNFSIKYKAVAGQQISLKMEGIVDVPLFNMIALIYEMQGYNKWMPFCQEGKRIKQMSKTSLAGKIKFNIPPPVFDREAYVYGMGFDRLAVDGSVFIAAKSIHNNRAFLEKFEIDCPAQSKTTRMDMEYMGGAFYPIGRNKMRVILVNKLDMKLKFVPLGLVNWIVRKAAQFLLDKLVKKATNFKGTLWEQRIQEDRDFYGWLETKLEDYWKEQEAKEQAGL